MPYILTSHLSRKAHPIISRCLSSSILFLLLHLLLFFVLVSGQWICDIAQHSQHVGCMVLVLVLSHASQLSPLDCLFAKIALPTVLYHHPHVPPFIFFPSCETIFSFSLSDNNSCLFGQLSEGKKRRREKVESYMT